MRDLLSDETLMWKFSDLLKSTDLRLRLYVYLFRDGRKITPALYKGAPIPDLPDWLRDVHGGGDFVAMIRRGETMLISGALYIARPLYWRGSR